jgi:hypothetical protein
MMKLTLAQKQAIKSWIVSSPTPLFDAATRDALNAPAAPDYRVWRSSLNKHDLIEQTDKDDTNADTSFAGGGGTGSFIDRSQGERDGWRELWNSTLSCKPYLKMVRVMVFDIFSGTAALAVANRKHFWARGQRSATVLEKLVAVATAGGPVHSANNGNNPAGQTGARGSWTNPDSPGIGTDGNPVEGAITLDEVVAIFSVPL